MISHEQSQWSTETTLNTDSSFQLSHKLINSTWPEIAECHISRRLTNQVTQIDAWNISIHYPTKHSILKYITLFFIDS